MLVLVGRSCTGKNTVQEILVNEYGMDKVVTCTSRPPRDGEVDGVDYHFIDANEMVDMYCNNEIAEITKYDVASGETWYYGSLTKDYEDSDNKVIILNPDGLRSIRKQHLPAFVIEITSTDNEILSRQVERGDDPDEAARRFDQDKLDFSDLPVDTMIINWGEGGADRCARNIYYLYKYWL